MASADYTVLTPERVSLQYDIAGIGSRGAAALVDTAVQALALLVVLIALAAALAASNRAVGAGSGALFIGVFALAVFAVTAGYFMLFEILWSGQTPGKRLVGVRVIRENGYPIRPVDAVIRNLVRIADWLPGIYGVGVVTMLLNRRARRLGDFASGTIVVREGGRGPGVPPMAQDVGRGYALGNADATLVRDFLLRRAGLSQSARAGLALRLAGSIARRYGLPLELDPETFLERLAA
jgi:uncharacterized RDD family membrane protein YckC